MRGCAGVYRARRRRLPHIFDEFHQVKRQGGDQTEGTGLGLAIAKKTVELLGGELTATSEVVGAFTLRISDYESWARWRRIADRPPYGFWIPSGPQDDS